MTIGPFQRNQNQDAEVTNSNRPAEEADTGYISPPTAVSLPQGGGAIQGIGEKFDVNPVTGTGALSIPIAVSPGRAGFTPQLAINYDSGAGNSPFGMGWQLSVPSIQRKTQKGLPQYRDQEDSDIYILSGAEDLVPSLQWDECKGWEREKFAISVPEDVIEPSVVPEPSRQSVLTSYPHLGTYWVQRYRPRIEGLFARIERWQHQETGDVHWRSVTPDNLTSVYGKTPKSRIADPVHPDRIFEWLLCESYDDKGNVILYQYKQEDATNVDPAWVQEKNRLAHGHSYTHQYLKRVFYGNRSPYERSDWFFQVVFDYGEHGYDESCLEADSAAVTPTQTLVEPDVPTPDEIHPWPHRPDAFSTFRSGFEIRTQRLCRRVLMFHQFAELGKDWTLVWSTDLQYEKDPVATYLTRATHTGYVRDSDRWQYRGRSYPPLELTYDRPQLNDEIRTISPESLENLPVGLDGVAYQWLDLDGEGISGILTEQARGWFYKANQGAAEFAPVQSVLQQPSLSNLGTSEQRFVDLAGDGQQDLVVLARRSAGFYERTDDQDWQRFRVFKAFPTLDWDDPNLRLIDLTGDGLADLLISEQEAFVWHPSQLEDGFGDAARVFKPFDEEQGPALVFAEPTQTIFLADMTGDGLNDIVRIRNHDLCYWPNLGYGHFGTKVTMGQAPYFDHPELFNPQRIRLADIDGSGTTDVIYLGQATTTLWFNQAGNRWSPPHPLRSFPKVDNVASVQVVDLFGNGTACLVWSSPLPGQVHGPLRYIDLMGNQKPHLLRRIENNLGAETRLHYVPATQFYLEDKKAGHPWISKIPFPVHVIERVESLDRISGNRFVSRYRYRHGYFDGAEREFRGFGYVEQLDTESFAAFQLMGGTNVTEVAFHVPPVLTKTWFHIGFYMDREHVSKLFATEYYTGDADAVLLPDTLLPTGVGVGGELARGQTLSQILTPEEEREACRALKGSVLRQEVYTLDDTPQSDYPYTVSERNYEIRWLQPRQDNQYAVFFTHAREALDYAYDRNPTDPRISHQLTLTVDEFGTVRQSAAVVYPRRQSMLPEHPIIREAQTQTYITCSEVDVIHRPDSLTFYRLGLPVESRAYELTGLEGNGTQPFSLEQVQQATSQATEISYEARPTSGLLQKRLVERDQVLYYRNDLTGALPLGEVESLALPYETYRLAFTLELLERIYSNRVNSELLEEEGGYRFQEELWWVPSGRQIFDPAQFYWPVQSIDPLGNIYTNTYDAYTLLTERSEDPLGNQVVVENDYRVLQPWQLTDPNGNRSQVAFDMLGMVVGTAIMGKVDEAQGDSLERFQADLDEATIQAHVQNPLENPQAILGSATSRMAYDLWAYSRTRDLADQGDVTPHPTVMYALTRETHEADLAEGETTKIQHSFVYSDGFGRAIQTKAQAEPGPAPARDAAGVLRCDQNLVETNPRWIGTGRTIYNNKGNPVKQYEPFFSSTHRYETEPSLVECGVTPILFYDPIQRVIATLLPNHTYSKVVFDPWHQASWDSNDTVLQTNPAADPDVGGYFGGIDEAEYLPTWYSQRIDGDLGAEEKKAAQKTVAHANTPSVLHSDTLGRPIVTIEDNGEFGQYETRVGLDIESHQLFVVDARNNLVMVNGILAFDDQGTPQRDALDNPIIETTAYNLLGHSLYSRSSDAGEGWTLNNIFGNPIRSWNSRGFVTRLTYDELQRPTQLFVRQGDEPEILTEKTVYGESYPDAVMLNLRGQVYQQYDSAGVVTNEGFDFKGNLLQSHRQLTREYRQTMDWSVLKDRTDIAALDGAAAPLLEDECFTASTTYDALNRPVMLTAPDRSEARPTYNEANLLEQMQVRLRGAEEPTLFVADIDYNEKGQRTLIEYGNGVRTEYFYDRETFRLTRMLTTRSGSKGFGALQDLRYTYDPVGNVALIQDRAQQTIFFKGEVVSPDTAYVYDALYWLRQAEGREHIGQTTKQAPETRSELKPHYDFNDSTRTQLPHPNDGQAMRNYREQYTYDAVGNFVTWEHRAEEGNWTRRYAYAVDSNRLEATSLPGEDPPNRYSAWYDYDAHGNMTRMPHLPLMQWDYKDQLQATSQQVTNPGCRPEITYYVYDAAGQRARKVTERAAAGEATPTRKRERIYVGGFEVYREYGGDGCTVTLERETLQILDGQQRIVLVETKTAEVTDEICSPTDLFKPIIRYQLSNHLGSAALELDAEGAVISYEEYHPYGTTAYQAGRSAAEVGLKRYRYAGKERDEETGLGYHGARYYASWLGRWIAADPIGLGDGINLYAYVSNNPANITDTSGTNGDDLTALKERRSELLELKKEASDSPDIDEELDVVNASISEIEASAQVEEEGVYEEQTDQIDESYNEDINVSDEELFEEDPEFAAQVEAERNQPGLFEIYVVDPYLKWRAENTRRHLENREQMRQLGPEGSPGYGGPPSSGSVIGGITEEAVQSSPDVQEKVGGAVFGGVRSRPTVRRNSTGRAIDSRGRFIEDPLRASKTKQGTKSKNSNSNQSQKNELSRFKGTLGQVKAARKALKRGEKIVASQVRAVVYRKTSRGISKTEIDADLVVRTKSGKIKIIEAKNGPSANLRDGQKIVDKAYEKGEVVGVEFRGYKARETGISGQTFLESEWLVERF